MTTNPFAPLLARRGHVVLDGGLATALEERGHRLDTSLWSARLLVDAPDEIAAVHRAYLDAGADCITTASYQATVAGFRALGFDDAGAERLLLRSVELAASERDRPLGARPAAADADAERASRPPEGAGAAGPSVRAAESGDAGAPRRALVAASIGPYGAWLADGSEYRGDYGVGRDVLGAFHRRRFELLAGSGADLLACETLPSATEAEVLLDILDATPGAWAWMSFTCRDGARLHDGTPFIDVVRSCAGHARVAAVGINCTAPGHALPLIERAAGETDLPLIVYPNSGEVYDAGGKRWTGHKSEDAWLELAERWRAAGASILGGCCRVGPSVIARLRARL